MPANTTPTISSPVFSFTTTAISDATTGRGQNADDTFSRMLQGQMNVRGDTRMPDPSRDAAAMRAPEPERKTQARETPKRESSDREPERSRERDLARPVERERSADRAERPAETIDTSKAGAKKVVKDTAREAAKDAVKEAAADASATAAAAASSNTAAPAKNVEGENATLAGLPAAIAALASKLAGAAQEETATPESEAIPSDGKSTLPGLLTGNSLAKSSNGATDTLALMQNAAADTDKAAKAGAAAQPQAAQMQTQIQARPDASALFVERQATALQAVPGEISAASIHGAATLAALRSQTGITQTSTPQLPVTTPAGQSGWAEEIGNRVTWMVGRAESKAELVLTPPNLGRIEISINLNGDQTTAQFVASTQAARDALEQALPRLREMLQQSGIALGQANVSTSNEQQQTAENSGGGHGGSRGSGGTIEATGGSAAPVWIKQHDGMVDTFA